MLRLLHAATLAVVLFASASSCVKKEAALHPETVIVNNADEIAIGQQAGQEVLKSIGPYWSSELEAYVSDVGLRVARTTVRARLPWEFHVIDDDGNALRFQERISA